MSNEENDPAKENPQPQQGESEVKPEEDQESEISKESPIKRIFNHEKVEKYYKEQLPPLTRKQKFIDQIFPPIIDSLQDRSNKRTGVDKISVQEIDWKKASELFPKLCVFPNQKIKVENSENEFVEFILYIEHYINRTINRTNNNDLESFFYLGLLLNESYGIKSKENNKFIKNKEKMDKLRLIFE